MVSSPAPRSSRSAKGALWYVTEGKAHDGKDKPRNWFVGSYDCTVENANTEWAAIRKRFGKDDLIRTESGAWEGEYVQAQHILLSFDRCEYNPDNLEDIERAWRQGMRTTDRLRAGHQAMCAVQTDGESGLVHCHILIHAVHPETGRSINGKHPAKDINHLRRTVNEVATEYGFDNEQLMSERRSQKLSSNELSRKQAGEYVPKVDLFERLNRAAENATTREEFVKAASEHGVVYRFRGKSGSSASFIDASGTERKYRGRDLGSQWMAKGVDVQIDANLVVRTELIRRDQERQAAIEAEQARLDSGSTIVHQLNGVLTMGRFVTVLEYVRRCAEVGVRVEQHRNDLMYSLARSATRWAAADLGERFTAKSVLELGQQIRELRRYAPADADDMPLQELIELLDEDFDDEAPLLPRRRRRRAPTRALTPARERYLSLQRGDRTYGS